MKGLFKIATKDTGNGNDSNAKLRHVGAKALDGDGFMESSLSTPSGEKLAAAIAATRWGCLPTRNFWDTLENERFIDVEKPV